eukprot:Tamp_01252.p1 GENE.Tamp_01252~~Tamp_01252.p1  ORF type:complete len:895 (-),score=71.37 Tamp_01252:2479-5163(-)
MERDRSDGDLYLGGSPVDTGAFSNPGFAGSLEELGIGVGHVVDVDQEDWWEDDLDRIHLPGFGVFDSRHIVLEEDMVRLQQDERGFLAKRLFEGQAQWRQLPRWEYPAVPFEDDVKPFMPAILRSRRRRPSRILLEGDDPLSLAGIFWDLSDFQEWQRLGPKGEALWQVLVQIRAAQEEVVAHVRLHGTMPGDQISAEGCRSLGFPEDVIDEMINGGELPFTQLPDKPSHSAPYSGMYRSVEALLAAAQEFLRTLQLGKLLPLSVLAFLEAPTTVLVKPSTSEASGKKYRICTDCTASGLNPCAYKLECPMVSLTDFISSLGPGAFISKQDARDFFLCFRVASKYVRFFGVQCPLSGQSMVYCYFCFGARMSPPITCRFMTELSRTIVAEVRRRERGEPGLPAFAAVPIAARPPNLDHSRNADPPSASSSLFVTAASSVASFVDDQIASCLSDALGREYVALSGLAFELSGIFEKLVKRVESTQEAEVLGLDLDTPRGVLTVPIEKRQKLLALVEEGLAVFDLGGTYTVDILGSVVGKLQDASQGYPGSTFFLFELRLPLALVQHLLPTKGQRCRFLIPTALFPRMRLSLVAWRDCLQSTGGTQFYVQPSGNFGVWKWCETFYHAPLPLGVFSAATDASKRAGGVTFAGARLLHEWSDIERALHINILESLMPVWFLQECGPQVAGLRGVLWVDSRVAMGALNAGRSKNKLIAAAARSFKLLCLQYSVQIHLCHIPTLENLEADYITRGVLGRRIADWGLVPLVMDRWDRVAGGFDVDAFASPSGDNARAPLFCSALFPPETFVFAPHHVVWAFPPPHLAAQTVVEAARWPCAQVYLAVPSLIFDASSAKSNWSLLHEYRSGSEAGGVFQRMVAGGLVACKAPGFAVSVFRRCR